MRIELDQVLNIARKEWRDRIRNRWALAAAILFTLFALAIAYFGAAQQGMVGLRSADLTIASLVSLAIYLVPLVALLLGYDTLVGEREKGSLALLLSMPITRLELVLGKYLGLAGALVCSTVAGFALVGLLLAVQFGLGSLVHYGGFVASTVLLGLAFLSIATLISACTTSRVGASGLAIACWFALVLVYDLALLALLVTVQGRLSADLVPALLMLDPADVFRMLNLFGMEDVGRLYGLAAVVPKSFASPLAQGAAMLAWIVVPLVIAARRFR